MMTGMIFYAGFKRDEHDGSFPVSAADYYRFHPVSGINIQVFYEETIKVHPERGSIMKR
jgi:hypothetical protein